MSGLIQDDGSFQVVEELEGLSIGIVYFDDRGVVYVSKSVFEKIKTGKIKSLEYAILTYQRSEKAIEKIANEIVDELKKCPPGRMTDATMRELEKTKSTTPNWILNPYIGIEK